MLQYQALLHRSLLLRSPPYYILNVDYVTPFTYNRNMWQETDNQLQRTFNFADFKSALAFVNKVGDLAERAGHHPDIELGWGKVVVHLSTHSEGGVTEKDRNLAKEIDTL